MAYIIFPLGNSESNYFETRHNAGRFVYEKIKYHLQELNKFLQNKLEHKSEEEIIIFLPKCFMNESGKYLKDFLKNNFSDNLQAKQDFKIDLKNFTNLIVMYDDKDLEIGDVRIAIDRGDGGHNGLKSIIQNLQTKNFYRIRIGIAPKGTGQNNLIPPYGTVVQEYVLAKMTNYEKEIFSDHKFLDKVVKCIREILYQK